MLDLTYLNYGLLFAALFIAYKLLDRRKLSYPPGPKGYPFIGNLFDIPSQDQKAWEVFSDWSSVYGGLISFTVFNTTTVVINDPEIAMEMMEKKGLIYSNRPASTMQKLCSLDKGVAFLQYTKHFTDLRKLLGRVLGNTQALERFLPFEEYQSSMIVKRILADPEKFDDAVIKTAGDLVLQVTYGYRVKESGEDILVVAAEKLIQAFGEIAIPGRFLADTFPFLKYVPAWVPGAGSFQGFAKESSMLMDHLVEDPFKFVQEGMKKGTNPPSYVSELLSEVVDDGSAESNEAIYNIKYSAASLYAGGTDTTTSVLIWFILAMTCHPEVQKKLQDEVDRITGKDRLPTLQDRKTGEMPYIEAVMKEVYRWMPAGPFSLPHVAATDDVQNGYFIPKGAVILANTWRFLHDPNLYKDPFIFNPDRFLGPNPERDPLDFAFGYGRRICPGLKLADISIWIIVAKMMATLNISKAKRPDGTIIEPPVEHTQSLISRPRPFKCSIVARSQNARDMIEDSIAASGF